MQERPGKKASKPPARDLVYQYVRDKVLSGAFKSGEFIEEQVISDAVGVSRTPVREAFHRLENDYFVTMLPRRGASIRPITGREYLELYESRRVIECHAVRRICAEKLPVPSTLRDLCKRMRATTDTARYDLRSKLDRQFHCDIVAAIDNTVMNDLYDSLQMRQLRVAVATMSIEPSRAATIDREHDELVEALERHDAARAVEVVERHLKPVLQVLTRLPR